MGRRGWRGDPPANEAEARRRMLAAAITCVQRLGAARTGLSDVADELGVTRQTVYRLFPTTETLLTAAAESGARALVDRISARVRGLADPVEIVVEAVAYGIEQLPAESYMSLLLARDSPDALRRGVTSPTAMAFGTGLLRSFEITWADTEMSGLVEFLLRQVTSFMLDPGDPPKAGTALRTYLRTYVGPAVSAATAVPAARR